MRVLHRTHRGNRAGLSLTGSSDPGHPTWPWLVFATLIGCWLVSSLSWLTQAPPWMMDAGLSLQLLITTLVPAIAIARRRHLRPELPTSQQPISLVTSQDVVRHDVVDSAQVRDLYRERAHLLAALTAAASCPAVICDNDPMADRPVVYVDSPCGQLSWHVDASDLDLLGHMRVIAPDSVHAPVWDGHSTAEKYERLDAFTKLLATCGTLAAGAADMNQNVRFNQRTAGRWSGQLLSFGTITAEGHRLVEPACQDSDPWQADAELRDEHGTVIGTVEQAWIFHGALYGSGRIYPTPAGIAAVTRFGGPVEVELSETAVAPVLESDDRLVMEHRLLEPWHLKSVSLRRDRSQHDARIAIVAWPRPLH